MSFGSDVEQVFSGEEWRVEHQRRPVKLLAAGSERKYQVRSTRSYGLALGAPERRQEATGSPALTAASVGGESSNWATSVVEISGWSSQRV